MQMPSMIMALDQCQVLPRFLFYNFNEHTLRSSNTTTFLRQNLQDHTFAAQNIDVHCTLHIVQNMQTNHVQTLGYRRLLGAFGVQHYNEEEPCQGIV